MLIDLDIEKELDTLLFNGQITLEEYIERLEQIINETDENLEKLNKQ